MLDIQGIKHNFLHIDKTGNKMMTPVSFGFYSLTIEQKNPATCVKASPVRQKLTQVAKMYICTVEPSSYLSLQHFKSHRGEVNIILGTFII